MELSVGKGKSVFRVCVRLTLVTDLVLITATAPDKTSPGRSKVKIYPRNDFVSITMIISHLLILSLQKYTLKSNHLSKTKMNKFASVRMKIITHSCNGVIDQGVTQSTRPFDFLCDYEIHQNIVC